MPGFELGQIALRNAGIAGQYLSCHAAPGPGVAHPFAQCGEVGVVSAAAMGGCGTGSVGRGAGAGLAGHVCIIMLFVGKFHAQPYKPTAATPLESFVSQPITILVGTMTGTAEMVAADVKAALAAEGHVIDVLVMDNLLADVFERPGAFLVCTSTYGQGDVPDNARALFDDLKAKRPDLSGKAYGVIGLGDSTYFDTFNHGGKQFDDLLQELGAVRTRERMAHNAMGDPLPETMAIDWAREWVKSLSAPQPA